MKGRRRDPLSTYISIPLKFRKPTASKGTPCLPRPRTLPRIGSGYQGNVPPEVPRLIGPLPSEIQPNPPKLPSILSLPFGYTRVTAPVLYLYPASWESASQRTNIGWSELFPGDKRWRMAWPSIRHFDACIHPSLLSMRHARCITPSPRGRKKGPRCPQRPDEGRPIRGHGGSPGRLVKTAGKAKRRRQNRKEAKV